MRPNRFIILVLLAGAALASGCARLADREFITDSMRSGEHSEGAQPLDSLVVASYNIRYGQDIEQAIADIRADPMLLAADILLLQEMDAEGTDQIAAALGYNFVYYAATTHPKYHRLFGNAVLARATITRHEFLALPVESPFPVTARIAVVAEIATEPLPVVAVSIHTSTVMVEQSVRLEQYQLVSDSLLAFTGPIVIGGDFNTPTYDDVRLLRERMRERGYLHARPEVPTAHLPWWQQAFDVQAELDHLFFQRMRLRRNGVSTGATASDHLPIWAVFEWAEEP